MSAARPSEGARSLSEGQAQSAQGVPTSAARPSEGARSLSEGQAQSAQGVPTSAARPSDGPLVQAVLEAFSADGALAHADPGYRERGQQTELAREISRAVEGRRPIVAEAGTGVGKTYAYLVPALLADGRVLVSTATKSLQDQLFLRDLPHVRDALQMPVQLALLKGRGSYLCVHRLQQARQSAMLPDRFAVRTLAKIEQWSQSTRSGDLAELEGLDDRSPVIPLVTSSRDNCLGSECPSYRNCHVMKARRDALAADVVVVNHHLFFADLALRETGMAELLPNVDVVIFDEAHQLAEAGVQFLGATLGTAQVIDFGRDMLAAGLQHARGLAPWSDLAGACDRAARDLRLSAAGPLRDVRGIVKLRWQERAGRPEFTDGLQSLAGQLREASAALERVSETAPDFPKLQERADQLVGRASAFLKDAPTGSVRWIDISPQQARLVESPLDIRETMREQIEAQPKAWVFTSATLGDDERLSWFTEPTGLDDAQTLRVGSPFDYPEHARVYVPRTFPKPNEPGHPRAVAALAARLAGALGGRTFVLTTTLRALQQIGDQLRERFEAEGQPIDVLVQGAAPKRQLMQRFLEQHAPAHAVHLSAWPGVPVIADAQRRGAVLVGSQTFWEGIDVPGDALQCVVIDKLPFPPPNDPLVEARVKRLESEGRNAFNEYFVAEAAVALKQGAGRLIRTESDRGLLVVCDPRMVGMGYGRRLLAALPPMQRLASEDEALEWLTRLREDAA
ncbi:ATP-dependent DNA helicase [Schlegelella sp. S2-27]|uniref:ATP-dependent DNA helicase n=1 Tax=Caldimonas mangrovi TaxID=2944811 RepID=A0ABT0YQS8_9BURK|nr:ATP-dependent DNA helicase [Caldimonas mangrovi]MCM5680998.1 ATP-dependent DNA helicase [Caldimonas mangrovi]